ISSVTKTSDEQTSISVSVTASDTNGISKYYYSINSGSYKSSTSKTYTFSGLTKGTSYTIKVYAEDKAGNTSLVTTKTFETKADLCTSGDVLGSCLTSNNQSIASLSDELEGGLYRYQGTSADNYICFGTSDKATCTGNTDAYMYRIIGINSSNQLKLIKKEALNDALEWNSEFTGSNETTDLSWKKSSLRTNLNGSTFLTNTTYVPSGWSDKIATTTWKYGDNKTANTTAANLYSIESAWTDTTIVKIGLMYAHDYYYGMSGGNNCSSSGAYSTCKTSWLHLSNNDSGAPETKEWTMSRLGRNDLYATYSYSAWYIAENGTCSGANNSNFSILTKTFSVRPVFYLVSDVSIVGGSGTLSDPFIIS
ncbi:MAG: fibronectin type III domain-containing protein, partial [Bacilli bacterium]|nr:fibronectin type III domain-containing protein [Bacilli bacterium]